MCNCERGILELTGRTIVVLGNSFFCMEKIGEANNEKECEEKKEFEELFVSFYHFY